MNCDNAYAVLTCCNALRVPVVVVVAISCAIASATPSESDESPINQQNPSSLQIRLAATAVGSSQRDKGQLAVPAPNERDKETIWRLTGRVTSTILPSLHATLSGGLTDRLTHTPNLASDRKLSIDLREGFMSWQIGQASYWEAGRIIERNGVAFSSSPSDLLRALATNTNSLDSNENREGRHGVYMVRFTHISELASLTLLHAPRLCRPDASLLKGDDIGCMQTNWQERTMLKASVNVDENVNPDFIVHHDSFGTSLAASLAVGSGSATTYYIDLGVSNRRPLGEEGLRFGRLIGYLPAPNSTFSDSNGAPHYPVDISVGIVHTMGNRLTVNVEYGRSGRAFDSSQWQQWFRSGEVARSADELAPLWFIRRYASAMQEPLSRDNMLVRFDLKNAFDVDRLWASGRVYASLAPLSTTQQLDFRYTGIPSSAVSISFFNRTGGRRTEFGSTYRDAGLMLRLEHYF